MSDFIPTTEQVRYEYASEFSNSKAAYRAFDSWLAQYEAKIIAETEERIIELIKKHEEDTNHTETHFEYWKAIRHIIRLIKGQQK